MLHFIIVTFPHVVTFQWKWKCSLISPLICIYIPFKSIPQLIFSACTQYTICCLHINLRKQKKKFKHFLFQPLRHILNHWYYIHHVHLGTPGILHIYWCSVIHNYFDTNLSILWCIQSVHDLCLWHRKNNIPELCRNIDVFLWNLSRYTMFIW